MRAAGGDARARDLIDDAGGGLVGDYRRVGPVWVLRAIDLLPDLQAPSERLTAAAMPGDGLGSRGEHLEAECARVGLFEDEEVQVGVRAGAQLLDGAEPCFACGGGCL